MQITIKGEELIDKYYKAIMDASDRCFKGFAFFLSMNAVVLGYLINSKIKNISIESVIEKKIIWSGIIVDFLYLICNISLYIFTVSIYKTYSVIASRVNENDKVIAMMVKKDVSRGKTVYHITFLSILSVTIFLIILYFSML